MLSYEHRNKKEALKMTTLIQCILWGLIFGAILLARALGLYMYKKFWELDEWLQERENAKNKRD